MDKFLTVTERPEPNVGNKAKRRKYDETYINLGFTSIGPSHFPQPQCVICKEVLANDSLRPAKLRRHLTTKHSELVDKPPEFFKRKLQTLQGEKRIILDFSTTNSKATEASYRGALRIAKAGKPHSIGETFALPFAKEMCSIMIGEAAAAKLDPIPLSDNTVARRISDMALDVKDQVIDTIKESTFFALQIDESTDVASCAQMLVYVRYRECLDIKEEFLFCRPLPAHATGEEMFAIVNDFMGENNIDWTRCCGICSDGARAMTGRRSGLVTRIQQVAPAAVWSHCIIHRQALAAKKMPEQLRTVLNEAVLIVNFIKDRSLNSRLFSILCEEMGAHYRGLLLHTEVRWLSRGKVLTRLCELREEVLLFLADAKSPLLQHMEDTSWVAKLAYLADIFDRMNMLNASLQGKECNVFVANERVTAFRKKLDLWATRVEQGSLDMFSTVEDVMTRADLPSDTILPVISEHLRGMYRQFGEYFREDTVKDEWVRNPFLFNPTPSDGLSIHEKEALTDLTADRELQQKIRRVSIGSFWLSVENEYPSLTEKAMMKLTPFSSTYMCESGFSALTYIKNKYRSRLAVEDDLRLFLSTQQPRISRLCAQRAQHHPSH